MHFNRRQRIKNLGIAGIAALTGFVSLGITLLALIVGLWLDNLLKTRGPATICLLSLSVPVSLFVMIRMALGLVKQLPPPTLPKPKTHLLHQKED